MAARFRHSVYSELAARTVLGLLAAQADSRLRHVELYRAHALVYLAQTQNVADLGFRFRLLRHGVYSADLHSLLAIAAHDGLLKVTRRQERVWYEDINIPPVSVSLWGTDDEFVRDEDIVPLAVLCFAEHEHVSRPQGEGGMLWGGRVGFSVSQNEESLYNAASSGEDVLGAWLTAFGRELL